VIINAKKIKNMKKIFTTITAFAAIISFCVVLVSWNGIGNEHENLMNDGAPQKVAGDPYGGNKTCATTCHSDGTVTPQTDWITSDIPVNGYVAGTTYNITATVTLANYAMFGFEVSPQNAGDTVVGTLIASAETQLKGTGRYVTQLGTSNTGAGSRSWTFQWTAPATGLGPVTFYGAFLAADESGDDTGDLVYTSTMQVSENLGIGIAPVSSEADINIYPSVSDGQFTLQVGNAQLANNDCNLEIYNMAGAKVYQSKISVLKSNIILPVEAGMYLAWIKTGNTDTLRKIIIK